MTLSEFIFVLDIDTHLSYSEFVTCIHGLLPCNAVAVGIFLDRPRALSLSL